ncbi:MAG TPA: hypothetical protein VG268_03210, partial [Streptosporangiaceae bacterium]|nr:hypothetical protein [Streptosporangiaceae bacterium]
DPITLADDRIELVIEVDGGGVPRLTRLAPATGQSPPGGGQPDGGQPDGGHEHTTGDNAGRPWRQLRVDQVDPVTGLRAEVSYRVPAGSGTVRSWVRLANGGPAALTVTSVTSFLCGRLPGRPGPDPVGELEVWCPEFTDAEIAFTLGSALLGRIHLSGRLDRMSPAQRALVAGAIEVYREIRPDLARAVPLWPLGLPGWDDPWLALALHTPEVTYLLTWRRPPGGADSAVVPLPHLRGGPVRAEVRYPAGDPGRVSWDPAEGAVTVRLPQAPAVCLIRLGQLG